jgi:5-methylcytosine-specific restriction protein B
LILEESKTVMKDIFHYNNSNNSKENDDLKSKLERIVDNFIEVIEDFKKDQDQYAKEKRKLSNTNLSEINKNLLKEKGIIAKIANIKAEIRIHEVNNRIQLCFLPLNANVSSTAAFVSLHYQKVKKEKKEELRFFYMKRWTNDDKKVFSSKNYKNLTDQEWEKLVFDNYKLKDDFKINRWREKDLNSNIIEIPDYFEEKKILIDEYLYNCGYLRKILSYNTQEDSKKKIINILISMLKDYEKLIYPEAFDQSGFFVSSKSPNQSSLINEEQNMKNEFKIPLNQILYGPPGTGKTYNTAIEALRIIMDKEDFQQLDLTDRTSIMEQYRYYKEKGQIKFITFHQSYSYEDFVEGIKPIMDSDEVKYEIKPGVLKHIANLAKSEYISPANNQIDIDFDNRRIFRVYLNELYDECIEKNILKYEKLYATDEIFNQLEPDDLILVYSTSVIKAIGLIKSKQEDSYNVEWLIKDESIPREKISKKPFLGRRVCQLSKESVDFEELKQLVQPSADKINRNYVLIIDEINRGVISKIMGELITLLEEDKRQRQENEISSILPYSGEEFILPFNLYIIGTMNTADRSIALMDIALRRRFTFKELMPDSALVKETINNNGETINLTRVFEMLNKKITILLDRDHQIGHSFFMPHKVYDIKTLKDAWFNSLLPLLNEYFYCDWQKLKLIIPTFIKNLLEDNDDLKISLDDYETSEEELFEFKKPEEFTEEEFFRAIKALES